jgi:hypothetical protein
VIFCALLTASWQIGERRFVAPVEVSLVFGRLCLPAGLFGGIKDILCPQLEATYDDFRIGTSQKNRTKQRQ